MNDVQARTAIKYFHNRSLKYSNYRLSFDELLSKLFKNRIPQQLQNLNKAIVLSELDESQIKRIFEDLADEGQGRIPSRTQYWFDALRGEVSGVTWTDIKEIAVTSAERITEGVISAGNTVLDTAKSLQIILPILVLGAVIFIVVQKTKRLSA